MSSPWVKRRQLSNCEYNVYLRVSWVVEEKPDIRVSSSSDTKTSHSTQSQPVKKSILSRVYSGGLGLYSAEGRALYVQIIGKVSQGIPCSFVNPPLQ